MLGGVCVCVCVLGGVCVSQVLSTLFLRQGLSLVKSLASWIDRLPCKPKICLFQLLERILLVL